MSKKYDFSGWATQNDIRCSDGRTIKRNAFVGNDGGQVPLVWQHNTSSVDNVLGHALLENRDTGVYAYCTFNETPSGQNAKELVKHGDINALSIFANKLQQVGKDVIHGCIKELSLVVSPANPGAYIDNVMIHSENDSMEIDMESAVIYNDGLLLLHSDDENQNSVEHADDEKNDTEEKEESEKVDNDDEDTVGAIYDSMTTKQKTVTNILIAKALEDAKNAEDDAENAEHDGGKEMAHTNVFENEQDTNVLSHDEMKAIVEDAKRNGSLKDAVLAHSITDVSYLFPDAKSVSDTPDFIKRDTGWVGTVMKGVHKTPFSRVKSIHANITADEARAKGYTKGDEKTDEVFTLLKRTTNPQTVYKYQKLDRDDVVDIIDFDVIAWVKSEMRMMLDEEIARAVLVGDGRLSSSDYKINDTNIRPIYTDADLYSVKQRIVYAHNASDDNKAKAFIQGAVKARKNYKGSGNPVCFTTEDMLTNCLLMEDNNGRVIYDSISKLATAMRVKEIITVPVMDNLSRTITEDSESVTLALEGIIVNLNDYNVGADKGGSVNLFEDFDLNFNKQEYLIETRVSGAMTKPYGAIVIESQTLAEPEATQG